MTAERRIDEFVNMLMFMRNAVLFDTGCGVPVNALDLIPYNIARQLPLVGETADDPEPIAYVRLYVPRTNWEWYITEFDGDYTGTGLTKGFHQSGDRWGKIDLANVQWQHGPLKHPVRRDCDWQPTRIPRMP